MKVYWSQGKEVGKTASPSVDYSADPQPVARIIHLMNEDVSNPKFNARYLLQAELSQVSSPKCLVKEGVSLSPSAYQYI